MQTEDKDKKKIIKNIKETWKNSVKIYLKQPGKVFAGTGEISNIIKDNKGGNIYKLKDHSGKLNAGGQRSPSFWNIYIRPMSYSGQILGR